MTAQPTTATLTVPGISCGHCKQSIEGAVGALSGVETVQVDIDPKTVEVTFDESVVDLGRIKAAIETIGYDVPEGA